MGDLTRTYNWSGTPLGSPDQWCFSLRSLVSLVLSSGFPTALFWGDQLTLFYNDPFRPCLGEAGNHPAALGEPGEKAWPASWPVFSPHISTILAGGEPVWMENQYLPAFRSGKAGNALWTYSISPVQDDEGEIAGVLVTCSELLKGTDNQEESMRLALENSVRASTEALAVTVEKLRTANEELATANSQLLRSNGELGQYAYVASHDLQEPLRKIRMFTNKLLSKKEELPEDTLVLVQKIFASAQRMSGLIGDLLDFSRLLKSDSLLMPVSLNEVIANVLDDFELLIEEKQVSITVGSLPIVEAVKLQMNQLFYNLINNAIKFAREGIPPVIRIHSEPVSQEQVSRHIASPLPFAQYYHVTIQDEGIGFETQYAEQIFEVFKRLHNLTVYPGSGIGLAICRRIADNHNGKLYAESAPGTGSVFHLLIPGEQQDYRSVLPEGFNWKTT